MWSSSNKRFFVQLERRPQKVTRKSAYYGIFPTDIYVATTILAFKSLKMAYTTLPAFAGYAMERSEMATQTLCKGLSLFRHVVSRWRWWWRRRKEEIKARRVKRQNETSHLPFGLFGRISLYSCWLLFSGNLICNSHELSRGWYVEEVKGNKKLSE